MLGVLCSHSDYRYLDIAKMLQKQREQPSGAIIQVDDASADGSINFPSGAPKIAFYKLQTGTGKFEDYTLVSAPYASNGGGGGISTINTDGSLHWNPATSTLRANTSIATVEAALSNNLQTVTLPNEAAGFVYVSVNGVVADASHYSYNPASREVTINEPVLNDFSIKICYLRVIDPVISPFQTIAQAQADKAETQRKLDYGTDVYGITWNRTHAAPEVTRTGHMPLHASLPVHNKMRRCLVANDGTVNYYLDKNNSNLREDGSAATLDGTHGQVMVEIPEFYIRYFTEGQICNVLISLSPFKKARRVPKMYVGAYKAALDNVNNKLASVVNDSPDFRGGGNQAEWDGTPKSQLGMPRTATSRINFAQYAGNRGANWYMVNYDVRKIIYWLITIEYATRNHQAPYSETLTAEGYKTGALGDGPTTISSGDWSAFNGYYPLIKCGFSNSLGNNTGVQDYPLVDFPAVGQNQNIKHISYRGLENWFGDLWEWVDGINFNISGKAKAYIATGRETSSVDLLGYGYAGELAPGNGYITDILFGDDGHILPLATAGGSSSTYYCDYFYLGSDGFRGLLAGGAASSGAVAGSACTYANNSPAHTNAYLGSRLCFFRE